MKNLSLLQKSGISQTVKQQKVNTSKTILLSLKSAYWNSYQTKPVKVKEKGKYIYELLNVSIQGVKRLFSLAYVVAAGAENDERGIKDNKKYFLPRGEIKNYNLLIDERNFHNQPINDLIKQYDEVRKVSTGQGDYYTTGCLLDYAYFKDNYKLIAIDLKEWFGKKSFFNNGKTEISGHQLF